MLPRSSQSAPIMWIVSLVREAKSGISDSSLARTVRRIDGYPEEATSPQRHLIILGRREVSCDEPCEWAVGDGFVISFSALGCTKRFVCMTRPFAWWLNHGLSRLFDMVHLDEFTSASVFQAGTLLLLMLFNTLRTATWKA